MRRKASQEELEMVKKLFGILILLFAGTLGITNDGNAEAQAPAGLLDNNEELLADLGNTNELNNPDPLLNGNLAQNALNGLLDNTNELNNPDRLLARRNRLSNSLIG
jgi:hypothetical protein